MSHSQPSSAHPSAVRRSRWLRLFALMVALLGLFAQQRVLTPVVRPSAPVVRLVAEHGQGIETQALRAQPALRAVVSPLFARVPSFTEPTFAWPSLLLQRWAPPSSLRQAPASFSHFHSKRRIPRMNSEEPPRA